MFNDGLVVGNFLKVDKNADDSRKNYEKMADPDDSAVDGTRNPVVESSDILKATEQRNREVCFILSCLFFPEEEFLV